MGKVIRLDEHRKGVSGEERGQRKGDRPCADSPRPPLKDPKVVELHRRETDDQAVHRIGTRVVSAEEAREFDRLLDQLWCYIG